MTKKTLTIVFLTGLFLTACKNKPSAENNVKTVELQSKIKNEPVSTDEQFVNISTTEIDKFNQIIKGKKLNTEEELMTAYNPKSNETEGNYTYTVTKKNIDKDVSEVTLIEDGMLSDSQAGKKVIMTLKKENNVLKVLSIKENFKCYKDRGHENWGIELCK
jgi:uncharacterized protein YbbC (DUF1343 family)